MKGENQQPSGGTIRGKGDVPPVFEEVVHAMGLHAPRVGDHGIVA